MDRVPSDSDRRNQVGYDHLHSRYVRRAKSLARDSQFRNAVVQARGAWNEKYPELRVVRMDSLDDLGDSEWVTRAGLAYIPKSLDQVRGLDDRQYRRRFGQQHPFGDWWEMIVELCATSWPAQYFATPRHPFDHPGMAFVSACLFQDPIDTAERAESLIIRRRLELGRYPFKPEFNDRFMVEQLTAEKQYLLDVIVSLLSEQTGASPKGGMNRVREIELAAHLFGKDKAASILGGFPFGERQGTDWYFIEVSPGVSTNDFKDAASRIVNSLHTEHPDRPLDELIVSLKREDGLTSKKIADLLGVDERTVQKALVKK